MWQRRRNIASQAFDPLSREAVNRAEYFNGYVWVSASGSYETLVRPASYICSTLAIYIHGSYLKSIIQLLLPQDDLACCPKLIRANIRGGLLQLWSWTLPLPIMGSGIFEVTYIDDALRIFRSGTSLSVQVKASAIEALSEKMYSR